MISRAFVSASRLEWISEIIAYFIDLNGEYRETSNRVQPELLPLEKNDEFYIKVVIASCLFMVELYENARILTRIDNSLHLSFADMKEKKNHCVNLRCCCSFLTGFKLYIGWRTNSLGILSEAAHSGLDLIAAIITLFAVIFADRPADEDHQYGHGKLENISAFVENTSPRDYLCMDHLGRCQPVFLFKTHHVETNIWSFIVMGTSNRHRCSVGHGHSTEFAKKISQSGIRSRCSAFFQRCLVIAHRYCWIVFCLDRIIRYFDSLAAIVVCVVGPLCQLSVRPVVLSMRWWIACRRIW